MRESAIGAEKNRVQTGADLDSTLDGMGGRHAPVGHPAPATPPLPMPLTPVRGLAILKARCNSVSISADPPPWRTSKRGNKGYSTGLSCPTTRPAV